MDAGGDHGSAAKGLVIDLEVVGSGPVSCCFFFPSPFFMCSFYFTSITMVCRPFPLEVVVLSKADQPEGSWCLYLPWCFMPVCKCKQHRPCILAVHLPT